MGIIERVRDTSGSRALCIAVTIVGPLNYQFGWLDETATGLLLGASVLTFPFSLGFVLWWLTGFFFKPTELSYRPSPRVSDSQLPVPRDKAIPGVHCGCQKETNSSRYGYAGGYHYKSCIYYYP